MTLMVTLDEKIARTERLLRRLDEDRPYLRVRVAALGAEHRNNVSTYTEWVRAEAEAELRRLREQALTRADMSLPQPAD